MPCMGGADQSKASATMSSSLREKQGSVTPIRAASRRNSSVLGTASPRGSIAGVLSET